MQTFAIVRDLFGQEILGAPTQLDCPAVQWIELDSLPNLVWLSSDYDNATFYLEHLRRDYEQAIAAGCTPDSCVSMEGARVCEIATL